MYGARVEEPLDLDAVGAPGFNEVRHFVDCILEDRTPWSNLNDAVITMKLCEAIRRGHSGSAGNVGVPSPVMPMKLSVSMRVAEDMFDKRKAAMSLEDMARMAKGSGFHAVCMRASQVGTHSPPQVAREKREFLDSLGLAISMATGDFPIPENNERGPDALRNITPYLDLAEALDCDLLRICMKTEDDIAWARLASDEAVERNIRLAHQSHHNSLFELAERSVEVIRQVGAAQLRHHL